MQTFLPYPSFSASARVLDRARLGKQRVEVKQIYRALIGETSGWSRHPAVRMWRGCEHSLLDYGLIVCAEWRRRGYRDSLADYFCDAFYAAYDKPHMSPPWLGDPAFHAAHRSNLLRKAPDHYGRFGWTESPDLPYVWPC